jgi:Nucleotide hydrolase
MMSDGTDVSMSHAESLTRNSDTSTATATATATAPPATTTTTATATPTATVNNSEQQHQEKESDQQHDQNIVAEQEEELEQQADSTDHTMEVVDTDAHTDTHSQSQSGSGAEIQSDDDNADILLPPSTGAIMSSCSMYPLSNYTFCTKDAQPEEHKNIADRLRAMEREYNERGMRRSVEAVLLLHNHGHPHVLLLQLSQNFFKL